MTVIAIDGTAAAGKGTLARAIAAHYNFAHMDTGLLYRLVARAVLEGGHDPADEAQTLAVVQSLSPEALDPGRVAYEVLRTPDISAAAALVATHRMVRTEILGVQRRFAASPPGGASGAVLDGRDIGTVVCPEATVKLFVNAIPEVRAFRRWKEMGEKTSGVTKEAVLGDILERDERDRTRSIAPLKPAIDAHLLDTSKLGIEAVREAAIDIIDARLKRQ
ncbi:MAG: (d)CMP kinase [Parvularculales bacterium]